MQIARQVAQWSAILGLGFSSACVMVPKIKISQMKVFTDTRLEYSPDSRIRVNVQEKDYAEYLSVVGRYDLSTIKHELQQVLSQDTVTVTATVGSRHHRLTRRTANPFTFSASSDADLVLQVFVDVFDYGDQRSLGGKLIRFSLLGGIGLLGSGEQAICIASYRVTEAATGQLVNEGTVQMLSGENLVPRKAYELVIRRTTTELFAGLTQ
jgi:hypothetical protein